MSKYAKLQIIIPQALKKACIGELVIYYYLIGILKDVQVGCSFEDASSD